MIDIKKSTILVVDDNPLNIQLVGSILKKAGYGRISFSTSGEHAISLANTIYPDLILLDIMMPDIDGYEVCKRIKANDNTKDIPIIFLTAKSYNEDVVKGLELGAVDYIMKPFDNEILLARVNTHLRLKLQSNQIEMLNEQLITKTGIEISKRSASESKLKAFFNQANFAVVILDMDSNIIDINDYVTKMSGFVKEQMVGKHINKFVYEKDKKLHDIKSNEIFNSGMVSFEVRINKSNNKPLWVHLSSTIVKDVVNSSEFIVSIGIDIDEQYKLKEQLHNNEKILYMQSRQASMGNMIGMIAHQWRQPLSIIGMVTNNIMMDLELDNFEVDILPEDLEVITQNIQYMDKTINDFRNFFKPNKDKTFTTLEKICDDSIKLISHSLKKNNIEIKKEYNCNEQINILDSELKQIILILINNAKDAVKINNKQNITISTSKQNDKHIIKVCDEGGGIPEDIMDKLGTFYFTTKSEGTGLGLYISIMILKEQLSGKLSWYNQNGGACFEVELSI